MLFRSDHAVQNDHLTVQPIEGANAGIPMCFQLAYGDNPVKVSLRQGLQQRDLVEGVGLRVRSCYRADGKGQGTIVLFG